MKDFGDLERSFYSALASGNVTHGPNYKLDHHDVISFVVGGSKIEYMAPANIGYVGRIRFCETARKRLKTIKKGNVLFERYQAMYVAAKNRFDGRDYIDPFGFKNAVVGATCTSNIYS